jgi:radical SAM superfamily enzyme YgiQ (UPF0313 family)
LKALENKYKVLLIQPTQYSTGKGDLCKQNRIYLPGLALPLLAAYTPASWDVEIVLEVIEEVDFEKHYDLVGIGAMGHAVFRAIDIADKFRKKGTPVFFGGYMASIVPQLVRDHCDSIIIGDGEVSYPQLLLDFEREGTIKREYDNQLKTLEGLPLPRYELLTSKPIGYMLPVQAGRGCPYNCSFCSIACIYRGKYMFRPIDDVIRDIQKIKDLGYKRFLLIDDNIASDPKYLKELAARIKPMGMTWASQCTLQIAKNDELLDAVYDSGCRILSFGIESLSQEGLNKLNKAWVQTERTVELLQKVHKKGILSATEMIIGTDGDTKQSLEETARFVIASKIPLPKFYVLTPLPGTDFYNEMKDQKRIVHEDLRMYTATKCVFKPKNFTEQELDEAYWRLYNNVYTLPNILKRTILSPHFFKSPLEYLFSFFANLVYRHSLKNGNAPNIL